MSGERAISDYAIIGNCESAALVNSEGGIDWLCLPAFDGPSFFGALLDREKGGEFVISPAGEYRIQRSHVGDTAILQTRFISERAVVRLTDFFVVAREPHARFYDFTSLHPTRKLVRLIELESGTPAEVEVRVNARPDYARRAADWREVSGGFACTEAALFANTPLKLNGDEIFAHFELKKPVHFVLDYADARQAPTGRRVHAWFDVTKAFWEEWNLFNYYRGAHEQLVRRSAVTLKLLTYAPTGAFVAAPTTSLPEKIGGESNWDYRFTWVRDTSLFINALFRIGYSGEAKAFLKFLAAKCEQRGKIPVLLPIRDGTKIEEQELPHLAGYRDSRPVRRGNRAAGQLQLDNFGHLLQSLFFWRHTGGKLDGQICAMGRQALDAVRTHWCEPDNGIWENVERRQHTYGKVAAWLAFARAHDLGFISKTEAQRSCAEVDDLIRAKGIHAGYLAEAFDTLEVGASAFLAYITGFLDRDIARSTRGTIEQRLAVQPWLYRSQSHRQSGEGAFILCSFWWIDHLLREREIARAEELLESVIARASPLGLFSEEVDPATGELLGNFPQAFSHLGLITAILNVERSKRDPTFARAPEHEKFTRSIGKTVGVRGVLAGFFRVPRTARLLFSNRSKWNKA